MRPVAGIRAIARRWLLRKLAMPENTGPIGPGKSDVGSHTYWGRATYFRTFGEFDTIRIGAYCSIADRVNVLAGGDHDTGALSTYTFRQLDHGPSMVKEQQEIQHVLIGNDVWIGSHAMIVGSVTVGNGSVIAAGAVVVDDVEPYTIVGGVPARFIRRRISIPDTKVMNALAWWGWSEELVREAEPLLRGKDVQALREFAITRGLIQQEDAT